MIKSINALKVAGIANPARDLKILQANFEGRDLEDAIEKRLNRVPMSQILGYRDFWKSRFIVTSDVLDPRPDSELFLDIISNSNRTYERILDLGAGSGALGLSALCEFTNSQVTLSDYSSQALDVAKTNAETLGLIGRVKFVQSDWLERIEGKYDLILCNPPYLALDEMDEIEKELTFEPSQALTDGVDGLSAYRKIAPVLDGFLEKNGLALFEHGYKQQEKVSEIFEKHGFFTKKYKDLSENPRIVAVFL